MGAQIKSECGVRCTYALRRDPFHFSNLKLVNQRCATMAAEIFIQGVTQDGKPFRPSDWAERLCGVMSCFRPPGAPPQSHLAYSPYVRPTMVGDVKCVVVDERLRQIEPLAYHFVLNFAKDNNLVTSEACVVPDQPAPKL
jgi:hypothetical protein